MIRMSNQKKTAEETKMRLLRLTLLSIAALALGTAPAFAADHHVAVGNNFFNPSSVTIQAGDRVIWTRMAGTHSATADDESWSSPVNGTWSTFERVFPSQGDFDYHCEVHPGMTGVVHVQGGGGGDQPGTIAFTGSANRNVPEGAGSITLTMSRTGGDDGPVGVTFETVENGTADSGVDFDQTNGPVNWPDNNDNNMTMNVPILDDDDVEGNETFSVHIVNPTGGASLGGLTTVNITIQDNDSNPGNPGTIRFENGTANVNEGNANASLTVRRINGSTGAVSVAYSTANGTAQAGSDFVGATNSIVSWGNGDSSNKTIQIPIVGDTVEEPAETFNVTLSSPTGGAVLGSPASATVTIADDDVSCDPCVANATTLCLSGGSGTPNRFRVRVTWRDFEGDTGPGMAVPYTPDSGFFWFFNAANLEYLTKMVNGCGTAFDAFWFFYAAATNLQLETEVLDTVACEVKTYSNPLGNFASDGDIAALPTCDAAAAALGSPDAVAPQAAEVRQAAVPVREVAPALALEPHGASCNACVANATTLCLEGGSGDPDRFEVKVNWTNFEGGTGDGMAVPYTPDSGFFWFFNAANLEYLTKMVNGCGTAFDAYWFFYAAATNLELETTVRDTVACQTKTYSNPLGNFASDGDIAALPTCAVGAAKATPAGGKQ